MAVTREVAMDRREILLRKEASVPVTVEGPRLVVEAVDRADDTMARIDKFTRQDTMETYEPKLPEQTIGTLQDAAIEQKVGEKAGISAAELEILLPSCERREMLLFETTVYVTVEGETEEEFDKGIATDETTLELELSEEATALEQPVDEQSPETVDVTTERRETLHRKEASLRATVKGPRLDVEAGVTADDATATEKLTRQDTMENYEPKHPEQTTGILQDAATEERVGEKAGISAAELEILLPSCERREMVLFEATVYVSVEGETEEEFDKAIAPGVITVEIRHPRMIVAVEEQRPVTREVTTEPREILLRNEASRVTAEGLRFKVEAIDTAGDTIMTEKLLRQYTVETQEPELPGQTTEVIQDAATQKGVQERAGISAAELEILLSLGLSERKEMTFFETTSVYVSTEREKEEEFDSAIATDKTALELQLSEEAAAPEEPVDEQSPATVEITTERREILIHTEVSPRVTIEGRRFEVAAVDTAGDWTVSSEHFGFLFLVSSLLFLFFCFRSAD